MLKNKTIGFYIAFFSGAAAVAAAPEQFRNTP